MFFFYIILRPLRQVKQKKPLFSGNYDAGDRFATLDPPFTKDSIYSSTSSHICATM